MTDAARLACITVTYHPDPGVLRLQLLALPEQSGKIIVDNGTPDSEWARVQTAFEGIAHLHVLRLGDNLGLASALNRGAAHARACGPWDLVLLLDQDSEPKTDAVQMLLDAHQSLVAKQPRLGAVGPALFDPDTGRRHGFHRMRRGGWHRVDADGGELIRADSLNGSGTLMSLPLFERLGGLEESLFIDHVDTEWSFRLMGAGCQLYGVPEAVFVHRMGEHGVRIWLGGWRVWPVRSPRRHHYLFRNTVALLRRSYVPLVWKAWAVPKLTLTWIVFSVTGPSRLDQNRAMLAGVVDGILGRTGRL